MAISTETLAAAMAYVKSSLAGAGAVAGKPCQIQSITEITGGNRVTFLWEDNEGVSHTSTMDVMDGTKGKPGEDGTIVVANPAIAGTEASLTSIEIDGTKYKIPQGGGGGGGSVDSVSVNGSTPFLPDSNGNVDLDIAAYASNNTMYIAAIEDGDGVIYPND